MFANSDDINSLSSSPSSPMETDSNAEKATTLGSLLLEWLPDLFHKEPDGEEIRASSESYRCLVAGITPPLSIPVLELWQHLCHPDNFLYIVILTR